MKFKYSVLFVLSLFLTIGLVLQAEAGTSKRSGTNAADELLIPVGARGTALGGANLSTVIGTEAIFYNPAGLGMMDGAAEVLFSHQQYLADIGVNYAALGARTGIGNYGISLKSLSFGDIPVTTEDAPEGTGATFSPNFMTVGISFARSMTDRITAGVNLKLINESIMSTNANALAFDLGVQYRTGMGVNIGVAMKNIGSAIKYSGQNLEKLVGVPGSEPTAADRRMAIPAEKAELPSVFEIGLSYDYVPVEKVNMSFMGNFRNHNFQNDEVLAGAEFDYAKTVFLRGSYSYQLNSEEDVKGGLSYIYGPAFGFGLAYPLTATTNICFDYAYRMAEYFDANQLFTLTITF